MTPISDNQGTSTRPYLLRALHDWCTDNGFTPYIAVYVDETVQVPREHVKNNEIVLNVGFEATSGLKLGNEAVEFRARFGGVSRDIVVPVDHVVAIYARENGQGMAFPVPTPDGVRPTGPSLHVASGGGAGAQASTGTPQRALRLAGGSDAPESETTPTAPASADAVAVPADSPSIDAVSLSHPAPEPGADPTLRETSPGAAPAAEADAPESVPPTPPKGPRPSLKRIK